MIVPVVAMPSLGKDGLAPEPDAMTTRLGLMSEVVISASGVDAVDVAKYKSFLRACPCRVGPFDILSAGDRHSKVSISASALRLSVQQHQTSGIIHSFSKVVILACVRL